MLDRRTAFLGLGTLVLALGLALPLVARGTPDGGPKGAGSETAQKCIDECLSCYRTCQDAFAYSTERGEKYVEAEHLRLLVDCAEVCKTTADLILHRSEFYRDQCTVCSDICERCAASCERFSGDPKMRACTEECRRCAVSCVRTTKGT